MSKGKSKGTHAGSAQPATAEPQSGAPEAAAGTQPATAAAGLPVDDWDNPLHDERDRRLPRIAGPSGLVIFGVTGDLSRKKLMPAVYDLANRGLLPPGFGLVGFARRDWEDEDFEK